MIDFNLFAICIRGSVGGFMFMSLPIVTPLIIKFILYIIIIILSWRIHIIILYTISNTCFHMMWNCEIVNRLLWRPYVYEKKKIQTFIHEISNVLQLRLDVLKNKDAIVIHLSYYIDFPFIRPQLTLVIIYVQYYNQRRI